MEQLDIYMGENRHQNLDFYHVQEIWKLKLLSF